MLPLQVQELNIVVSVGIYIFLGPPLLTGVSGFVKKNSVRDAAFAISVGGTILLDRI